MELEILKWVVITIMGFSVWFLKRTISDYDERLRQTERDIAEIRRDYLHRDDFKEFKLELRSMFDEIKADIRELKNK